MGDFIEAILGGILAAAAGIVLVVNGVPLLLAGLATGAICIATSAARARFDQS